MMMSNESRLQSKSITFKLARHPDEEADKPANLGYVVHDCLERKSEIIPPGTSTLEEAPGRVTCGDDERTPHDIGPALDELRRRLIQLRLELHTVLKDCVTWEVGNVIARRENAESDLRTVKKRLQREVSRLESFIMDVSRVYIV